VPGLKRGLRLRVALAFAIFCIIVVGTLGISLYIASDDIEEAHIEHRRVRAQLATDEQDANFNLRRKIPAKLWN